MRKFTMLCVFVFLVNFAFAQKYQIKGRVLSGTDSTVISQAIVCCHPDSTKQWGFTDENGRFVINVTSIKTKKISVSCVGYKKTYIPIHFNGSVVNLGTIVLPPQIYSVEDVLVKSNIPLIIQYGDTVQYNVTVMKLNEEWNALDLVSRFPGVFIVDNMVMVNGEPLLKVLLDGKEYYGDDVISALANIPASAINNIQSYGKESNFARLTGFKDVRENKAFNVRTKNPMGKKGWANAMASEGLNTNGEIHNIYGAVGNGTLDTPEHRVSASFNYGNLGKMSDGVPGMDPRSIPLSLLPPALVRLSDRKTGRINYDYTKEKINFKIGGAIVDSEVDLTSSNYQKYFSVANVFDSKELMRYSRTVQRKFGYDVNFDLEWTLSKKQTVTLSAFRNKDNTDESRLSRETILQDADSVSNSEIIELSENENEGVKCSFSWYYRILPGKRTLTLQANYLSNFSDRNNTPYRYFNEIYDKSSMSWKPSLTNNNLRQQGDVARKNYDASLFYNELIGRSHQLMVVFNYNTSTVSNANLMYRYDEVTDEYTSFYRGRSNNTTTENNLSRAYVKYDYIGSKKMNLSSNLGILHTEQSLDDELNPNYLTKADAAMMFADLLVRRKLSPISSLEFTFASSGNMPMPQQLSPIIVDNNPSQIRIGNPNLKNNRENKFSLKYKNDNDNGNSFTANVAVRFQNNAVVGISEFMPIDRDTVIYAINNPADTAGRGYVPQRGAVVLRNENRSGGVDVSSQMMYGFNVKPLSSSASFSLKYVYSKRSAYEGRDDFIRTHKTSFDFSLSSNISKDIDFKFLYKMNYSMRNVQGGNNYKMLTNGLSGQLSIAFLKIMRLTTSCVWYNERQFGGVFPKINSMSLDATLSAYLTRRRDFLLSLNGNNLLNGGGGMSNLLTDTYFMQNLSDGFGRYLLLKLSYKFNSMNKMSTPKLKKGEKTNSGGFFNN